MGRFTKKDTNNQNTTLLDRYCMEIVKEKNLTNDEEVKLIKLAREGDKSARDKLIAGNLKFVISIAKQYHNNNFPIEDLLNEGNLGLMRAVEKFDETKGVKFISYAVWWIRQAILQALSENSRTVRVPLNKLNILNNYVTIKNKFEQKYHRTPSFFEIAKELKVEAGELTRVFNSFKYTASIDSFQHEDDSYTMMEILADEDDTYITDGVNNESINKTIDKLLEKIPKIEADVLRCSFGLCKNKMSLEKIGEKLNLTKERIRQIREKAISRIRNLKDSEKLKKYLNKNIQSSKNGFTNVCELSMEIKKSNKKRKKKHNKEAITETENQNLNVEKQNINIEKTKS